MAEALTQDGNAVKVSNQHYIKDDDERLRRVIEKHGWKDLSLNKTLKRLNDVHPCNAKRRSCISKCVLKHQ